MSTETLAVILSALGLLITLGGGAAAGLAWVVRRFDAFETKLTAQITAGDTALAAQIKTVESGLGQRIDALDLKIDAVDAKLTRRIDALHEDLTEVKIAIARLEGPSRPPRLVTH